MTQTAEYGLCGGRIDSHRCLRTLSEIYAAGEREVCISKGFRCRLSILTERVKLAKKLGTIGGQNAVAESIKRFRDTVTERLKEKGIACGRNDVILSSRAGYRLAEWIVVRDGEGS